MEAKHTPGPWHTSEVANGLVIYDQQGWAVADAKVFHSRHTLEEAQANARLIAAAPTMYDYVAMKAAAGCTEAKAIMEVIDANT